MPPKATLVKVQSHHAKHPRRDPLSSSPKDTPKAPAMQKLAPLATQFKPLGVKPTVTQPLRASMPHNTVGSSSSQIRPSSSHEKVLSEDEILFVEAATVLSTRPPVSQTVSPPPTRTMTVSQ